MKKSHLLILIIIIGVSFSSKAQFEQKRFLVKSGHVEMKVEGVSKGTRSIWFDDYGMRYREEYKATTTTKVFGMKTVEEDHTLVIRDGKQFYSINLLEKTGTKRSTGMSQDMYMSFTKMSDSEKEKFGDQILESFGGERLGVTTFLGRSCEEVKIMGTTQIVYKGILLKSSAKILGMITNETAVSFEENISIPDSKFKAPNDIDWIDLNQNVESFMGFEDDYSNDEDDEVIAVTYPYDDFMKAVKKINYSSFKRATILNVEGQYMATFMKSMRENFTIVASSRENMESDEAKKEMVGYQHFSHNGHKMHFGDAVDEEGEGFTGSALIIEYPDEDMLISIVSMPKMSKDEVLKIADQLKF